MDGTAGSPPAAPPSIPPTPRPIYGDAHPDLAPPPGAWGDLGRDVVLGVVSRFSRFVLTWMNTTTVSNYDALLDNMTKRERPRGLITVSNHASTFDDPGVLSALIPPAYFATEREHGGIRWTMCTKEICASGPWTHKFFAAGKTVPISRGGGVNQAVMRTMAERVSVGDWLHIFPEGRVSPPDEKQGELGRLKWGLGKMLCDVHELGGPPPVVLPFWHTGMERVKPYGVGVLRAGERIHVTVGEPIDFGDLVRRCGRCGTEKKKERLFREMMSRVEEKMLETRARNLRERAEREHEKEKDKGA